MKIFKHVTIIFIFVAVITSASTSLSASTLDKACFSNFAKKEVSSKYINSLKITDKQYSKTNIPGSDIDEANGEKVNYNCETKKISFSSSASLSNKQVINFSNLKIEQQVREMLKIKKGKIYKSDIKNIKTFKYDTQAGNPSDIEKFVDLEEIEISGDKCLSDTSFLRGLKNLQTLHITHGTIKEFSILNNIRRLNVAFSSIENISSLKNLKNLKILNMNGMGIDKNFFSSNILSSLTNLEELTISQYDSFNIKASKNLENLKKLKSLHIEYGDFTDLGPIGKLTGLEKLSLEFWHSDKTINIKPLENLKKLKELSLAGLNIKGIKPLSNLINLEKLQLGSNQIEDISPLQDLIHLKYLDISDNKIINISTLVTIAEMGGFKSNGEIDISNNKLSTTKNSKNVNYINTLIKKRIRVHYENIK